ncbi:unnamed protein product [Meganyctiphanes norvegica]|uniref:C2H2-type domain-containing protein n=1 Tax=Meganyctiphanes norvegica TaxID=48144 RepID=A0AAV2PTT7_MEGNR
MTSQSPLARENTNESVNMIRQINIFNGYSNFAQDSVRTGQFVQAVPESKLISGESYLDVKVEEHFIAMSECHITNEQYNASIMKFDSGVPHTLVTHNSHIEDKPYKCSICNKVFSEKGNLKQHMKTHTGEKPHLCEQCSKRFTLRRDLIQHMRVHTGEKPYSCNQCDKTFSQRSTLVGHLRTHTGEKPYLCEQCGMSFSTTVIGLVMLELTQERSHILVISVLNLFQRRSA